MPKTEQRYVGIHNDRYGGMTTIGRKIRDAWVFGLIPETETCENWNQGGLNDLLQKVDAEWDKYGCLVSRLPEDLFKRHQRIHNEAIEKARAQGWNGDIEISSDI